MLLMPANYVSIRPRPSTVKEQGAAFPSAADIRILQPRSVYRDGFTCPSVSSPCRRMGLQGRGEDDTNSILESSARECQWSSTAC
jgi:hypothetical protein